MSGSWFHRIAPAWLMRLAEDAVGETGMMSNLLFPPRVRREGLRVKKLANRVLEDLFRQRQMNTRMCMWVYMLRVWAFMRSSKGAV